MPIVINIEGAWEGEKDFISLTRSYHPGGADVLNKEFNPAEVRNELQRKNTSEKPSISDRAYYIYHKIFDHLTDDQIIIIHGYSQGGLVARELVRILLTVGFTSAYAILIDTPKKLEPPFLKSLPDAINERARKKLGATQSSFLLNPISTPSNVGDYLNALGFLKNLKEQIGSNNPKSQTTEEQRATFKFVQEAKSFVDEVIAAHEYFNSDLIQNSLVKGQLLDDQLYSIIAEASDRDSKDLTKWNASEDHNMVITGASHSTILTADFAEKMKEAMVSLLSNAIHDQVLNQYLRRGSAIISLLSASKGRMSFFKPGNNSSREQLDHDLASFVSKYSYHNVSVSPERLSPLHR